MLIKCALFDLSVKAACIAIWNQGGATRSQASVRNVTDSGVSLESGVFQTQAEFVHQPSGVLLFSCQPAMLKRIRQFRAIQARRISTASSPYDNYTKLRGANL